MKKNDLLHFYRNFQIIDVTEQCTFEWYQKPSPCKAYLEVSDATGDFAEGETIQGQTSGATATVFSSYVDGSRVYVENISGTFQEGETIQGQSSVQTAIVNEFIPERSWVSMPNNIMHGSFDSIISKDLDDYLEWESSLNGANYSAILDIGIPFKGIFSFSCGFGVGKKVDSNVCTRYFKWRFFYPFTDLYTFTKAFPADFDYYILPNNISPSMIFIKDKYFRVLFYQTGKGTFRWRIRSIRVFKILV